MLCLLRTRILLKEQRQRDRKKLLLELARCPQGPEHPEIKKIRKLIISYNPTNGNGKQSGGFRNLNQKVVLKHQMEV